MSGARLIICQILSVLVVSAMAMAVPVEEAKHDPRGLDGGAKAPLEARLATLERRFAAMDMGFGMANMAPLHARGDETKSSKEVSHHLLSYTVARQLIV